MENEYEADLVTRWKALQDQVAIICKLDLPTVVMGLRSAKGPEDIPDIETFQFTAEQRKSVMKAMEGFIGHYSPDDPNSPLRGYYGESYSLGVIQAAHLIGKDRPILDIIKNKEIYDELVQNGFELVRDNATRRIVDKIIPEMQAHMLAGSNPLSVAERLQTLFGNQNTNWRRLARTEMCIAAETAKRNEWIAWGETHAEFLPAPDACPICRALKGTYLLKEIPIPGRDTHPHCRCAIRPATDKKEMPSTGGLAQRLEINNIHDMNGLLAAYQNENPGVLVNGFRSINEQRADYFMATNPATGDFFVSNKSWHTLGFQPSADLVRTMQKIRNGVELTFNEEYSVESLWHEICHNRAKKYAATSISGIDRVAMEACNQLVARHTYPGFLEKLGTEAKHASEVLENGYGYGVYVRNLRALLNKLGIEEKASIGSLEKMLFDQKYNRVPENLSSYLTKASGRDKPVIREAIGYLRSYPEKYQAVLEELFKEGNQS